MPEPEDPPFSPGVGAIFEVVARLRAPGGCPWDREQTHESLRPYLLEETYELLEAIDSGDDAKIMEELGFNATELSEAVAAKMVVRHPHVFGSTSAADADEVLRNWEHQKAHEARKAGRENESVVDRVPATLPALAWALGLQKRAARVGFDFASPLETSEAVAEEARELGEAAGARETFDELGDLLFAIVSLARRLKVNPEDALRVAGQRFRRRFAETEASLRKDGVTFGDLDPDEKARRWKATS